MSEYKFLNNPRTTKKKKPNKHEPKLLWPRCTKFMKNGGTYTYGVVHSTLKCLKRTLIRKLHWYWSGTMKINTSLIIND